MAFVYTEMHVFLALLVHERSYEDSVGQRHSAGEYQSVSCKMKVNTCTVCEIGLLTEEEDAGQIGFCKLTYVIVTVYFTVFESVIVSGNTCRPCYVSKRAYSCRVREF